jgi:acyl-CoA synthetase (NDP forming)
MSDEKPLERLFAPRSVAVVGASPREDSIAGRPLRILQQHGFGGRIFPVNPNYEEVCGLRSYPDAASLPEPVDVALLLVNAARVVELVDACSSAGVGYAVVIASGFAEQDEAGRRAQDELAALASRTGMRILGPNTEGFVSLHSPVPLSFSPTIDLDRGADPPLVGDVAVVSQSGGLGFSLFNDGQTRGLGFSHVVSTGNEADLDALDVLDFLVEDPQTRVVLLFVEGLRDPARLPELASRAQAAGKPIVVAKVGRSVEARRAALAHTAHEAGDDAAYDELFRDCGLVRAEDPEEAVDFALAFSRAPAPAGRRVGILTLSGGAGTWLADALVAEGFELPVLGPDLQERIRVLIPPYGAPGNPVDATAQVLELAGGVAPVLELLLRAEELDAVVLVSSLSSPGRLEHEADRIGELVAASGKTLLVYSYTRPHRLSIELLGRLGLAWYTSTSRTARALRALTERAAAARRAV